MPIRAGAARYRHLLLHRVTQRVERLTRVSPLFFGGKRNLRVLRQHCERTGFNKLPFNDPIPSDFVLPSDAFRNEPV